MKRIRGLIGRIAHHTTFMHKIMLSCMALITLAILILSGYCIYMMQTFSFERAEESMSEVLGQMSATLADKLTRMQLAAQNVSHNSMVAQVLQNTETTPWRRYVNYRDLIDPLLTSILSINTDLASLVLYQDNPVLVSHSPMVMELSAIEGESWPGTVMDYRQQFRMDKGQLCLDLRLMSSYVGAPVVLMEIRMDGKSLFDMKFDTTEAYALSVTDDAGETMWEYSTLDAPGEMTRAALAGEAGGEGTMGAEHKFWHMPIGELGWRLNMAVPYRHLMINTRRFTLTILLVTLICLLLMLPLSMWVAHSLVKRIDKLNRSMAKVASGNLDIAIATPYLDEIGMLSDNFDNMVHSLKRSMEELTKTEKKQKEAEMRALRAQINPHFLYNTLSLISWKAIEQRAFQVADTARTFSRFCRTVLNRGQSESLLSEEIVNVKCYVDIQREMHENSFNVLYDVPEELKQCVVPNFVLQPLVENAIVHGVDTVRGLKGLLCISVRTEGGTWSAGCSTTARPLRKRC